MRPPGLLCAPNAHAESIIGSDFPSCDVSYNEQVSEGAEHFRPSPHVVWPQHRRWPVRPLRDFGAAAQSPSARWHREPPNMCVLSRSALRCTRPELPPAKCPYLAQNRFRQSLPKARQLNSSSPRRARGIVSRSPRRDRSVVPARLPDEQELRPLRRRSQVVGGAESPLPRIDQAGARSQPAVEIQIRTIRSGRRLLRRMRLALYEELPREARGTTRVNLISPLCPSRSAPASSPVIPGAGPPSRLSRGGCRPSASASEFTSGAHKNASRALPTITTANDPLPTRLRLTLHPRLLFLQATGWRGP